MFCREYFDYFIVRIETLLSLYEVPVKISLLPEFSFGEKDSLMTLNPQRVRTEPVIREPTAGQEL